MMIGNQMPGNAMTPYISRKELEDAAHLVHTCMPPTHQLAWPLLSEKARATVWVKHENHTPTEAFKIREG